MRKLTVVLITLMLCLQVFSGTVAYGAVEDNILVTSYVTNKTSIYKGDSFTITLKCDNKTTTAFSDVFVSISESSSFYGSPSGSKKLFDSLGANATNADGILPELIYKGTGNELNLIITYDDGSTETETIYIKEAVPTDS